VENDEWWHYLETDISSGKALFQLVTSHSLRAIRMWFGLATGESNVRNSVSFGDGVYKSTDAGKTWQHMGLKDSERISAIVINPQNRTLFTSAHWAMHSARTKSAVCL